MTKRFIIQAPYQLKEITQFCKDDSSKVMNVARVWSSVKRQGKTTWDGKIGVSFHTDGRERFASVFRVGMNDQMYVLGQLKYTPALKWCFDHLRKVE